MKYLIGDNCAAILDKTRMTAFKYPGSIIRRPASYHLAI
jgi:hypothetical protein